MSAGRGSVLVRRAAAEDAAAVTELHAFLHRMHTEAHPEIFTVFDPEVSLARFERALAEDQALIWIAERDGQPVGYVYAMPLDREATDEVHEEHALLVHALAVDPRVRGAGVGRALMLAAEDYARAAGLACVLLNTWAFNSGAHEFYDRLGYERLSMRMRRRL
jgi:GNAT superfamily N-acetyltransferase